MPLPSRDGRGNSAVPPWFNNGFQKSTDPVVALCSPSFFLSFSILDRTFSILDRTVEVETARGPRGNGRTRRDLSSTYCLVQPLDSQATFGGGRCEGLQPATLFSSRFCGEKRFARAVPAYSSCSPSF